MKYYGAFSIPGIVTRIIPKRTEEKENKIYFEYIDFYKTVPINFLYFSEEGCYARIIEAVGKQPGETWSEDDIMDFTSVFNRFSMAYEALEGKQLSITESDAFLAFLELYGYQTLLNAAPMDLAKMVENSWQEFVILQQSGNIELEMDPKAESKKPMPLLNLLLNGKQHLKIAFIYEKTISASSWTYAHELGRLHLEEAFSDEVETIFYENVNVDNIDEYIELAINEKCNIIFTTSPAFVQASVKAAIGNPQVKILNCSLKTAHSYIRTYYSRMHEAKFLIGAIAGAMAENDRISYIADYPLFGTISHINAFALGAKMVNPRAKVYLEWSSLKDNDIWERINQVNPSCISCKDMMIPDDVNRLYGLYHVEDDGRQRHLAMPICNWGKIYEKLIRTIMDGSWKDEDNSTKAINYWWGMSSGMVDVICSKNLPIGIKRLIELLKNTISSGQFQLFSGILYSQDGIVHDHEDALNAEEIMEMDWLAENVIGRIPDLSELNETAKPAITQQGLPGKKG